MFNKKDDKILIEKEEYYNLQDCKKINEELEKEIKRLEYALNTRERTCEIGIWCKRCEHWVTDMSNVASSRFEENPHIYMYHGLPVPECIGGEVGYCNKYIDTLCPDFKSKY